MKAQLQRLGTLKIKDSSLTAQVKEVKPVVFSFYFKHYRPIESM